MPIRLNKNIAVSDSGMLFNPGTGESFSVNPIGLRILNLLREGKEIPGVVQQLADEYEIEHETAERDLMDFISMLRHHQLSTDYAATQD
jgi:hypothetical protein